jgi:glycosyltransferase involved in cell wall biosynthesis
MNELPTNTEIAPQRTTRPRLSAVIITKNEAANIEECLDSLAFCDERIVVDSGSSDSTLLLAKKKGARVAFHEWKGFGPQKSYAVSLAQGEWVLSIDADERVSPELAQAIRAAMENGDIDGCEILRWTTFCGQVIRRPFWNRDYILRLFRRGRARFSDDLVHERIVCDGKIARIGVPLMHHSVRKLEDALRRMDAYSTLSARQIVAAGKPVTFWTGIAHGLFAFVRSYVLQFGFLNGKMGFIQAGAIAEGTYYRYMKAWLESKDATTAALPAREPALDPERNDAIGDGRVSP